MEGIKIETGTTSKFWCELCGFKLTSKEYPKEYPKENLFKLAQQHVLDMGHNVLERTVTEKLYYKTPQPLADEPKG